MVKSFVSTEARILQQPHLASSCFSNLFPKKFFLLNHLHSNFSASALIAQNFMLVLIVKPPIVFTIGGFGIGAWRWPTLTWGNPTLPSAMHRFTTEFGMGSGGSNALWSSSDSAEMSCCLRGSLPRIGYVIWFVVVQIFGCCSLHRDTQTSNCLGVIWSSLTGN